jgi:hypothetical protein
LGGGGIYLFYFFPKFKYLSVKMGFKRSKFSITTCEAASAQWSGLKTLTMIVTSFSSLPK